MPLLLFSGVRSHAHELPVVVREQRTRVDFILTKALWNARRERSLFSECERLTPKLLQWCFLSAPEVRSDNQAIVEQVAIDSD